VGRAFLESLVARGMRGLRFITSDDHAGLKAARKATARAALSLRDLLIAFSSGVG
jgi:transposase-like protein